MVVEDPKRVVIGGYGAQRASLTLHDVLPRADDAVSDLSMVW